MLIDLDFAPDAARARLLDQRMHTELGNSLDELCSQCRDLVEFNEQGMRALIRSLQAGERYSPLAFACYYDLVEALLHENTQTAAALFGQLLAMRPVVVTSQQIMALQTPGSCARSSVYRRKMLEDNSINIDLKAPSIEVLENFTDRYQQGMALMRQAIPELAGEVQAIVREVVCVVGNPDSKMQFDGGSHYQLWGALFLNADFHPTPQAMLEVIAHESAHSLLFGFCIEEPLVHNADDEYYSSPLRPDPRPMDGIYHATFVSARMCWAMSRLLESGLLSQIERQQVEEARAADRRNFAAGYQIVAEHAQMSSFAETLMSNAHDYMMAPPA